MEAYWWVFLMVLVVAAGGAWVLWHKGGLLRKELPSPGPGPITEPAADLPEVKAAEEASKTARNADIKATGQEAHELYTRKANLLGNLQAARNELGLARGQAGAVTYGERTSAEREVRETRQEVEDLGREIKDVQPEVLDFEQQLVAPRQEVTRLEGELQAARNTEQGFSDQFADVQHDLDIQTRAQRNAEDEKDLAEGRLDTQETARREAEDALQTARTANNRGGIRDAERRLRDANRNIGTVQRELGVATSNLIRSQRQARDTEAKKPRIEQQLRDARQGVTRLEGEVLVPRQEVARLEGELQTARAAVEPIVRPLEQQLFLARARAQKADFDLRTLQTRRARHTRVEQLQKTVTDLEGELMVLNAEIRFVEQRASSNFPNQFDYLKR